MNLEERPEGIRIETVKTDSFSMDFFRFGKGKETLVILPGLSVQSVMNSAVAIAKAYWQLTDDFTIYVFDRRKELPASYPIGEMAKDTAKAFRAAGLEHASIFGASQGGMIAMELAIAYPALVDKLILGSTTARVEEFQIIENWIRLAEAKDAAGLYLAFGEAIYPQKMFERLKKPLVKLAKTVTETELDRFVVLAKGIKNFDVSNALAQISCPVLVIGDREDKLLGAEAAEKILHDLRRKSDVELYLYQGYGHAVYDTAPDYQERMLQFLKESGASGG